jgi:hypothetical protein
VCLDRPSIHPDDLRDLAVAATLQKQINDLLLARTQPHRSCVIPCVQQGEPPTH